MVSIKPSKFGIEIVGDIEWGTHLCQFYQTKEDLIDILVPYFSEGLKRNEFCIWVTSPSLEAEEAKETLKKALPNLDEFIRNGQIEILAYGDWYLKEGGFDADRVLQGWVGKERDALNRGFEGLRLTRNMFWIERAKRGSFVDYEAKVNKVIGQHRMIALCTYSLERCTSNDVIDVIKNHVGALIRKGKAWYLVEDVTERKQANEKLHSTSLYVRSLIEASLDPMVMISAEGKITDVNKATELITGNSREELIGNEFSFYFNEPEKAMEVYMEVFKKGFVRDYPLVVRHKSGKVTEVLYNATICLNERGEIQGVCAVARDITEHKVIEEKLKVSERLAAIGQTAGMVGHDIRNPLQSIEGAIYLGKDALNNLLISDKEKESVKEMFEAIDEQTKYINKIVSDLQDFAGPLKPELMETGLWQLIESSLSNITKPKDVEVITIVESDLPDLKVDPAMMNRVLVNLITNSVQAMPNGGKLTIKVSRKGASACISVQDTGAGIPEDLKTKIFQPMFTTKSKGQGFGLAVCKRIVEAHDGEISFESEVDKGTIFTIQIPIT